MSHSRVLCPRALVPALVLQAILIALMLALAPPARSAGKPQVFSADGLAIRGYDPVAYFTEGEPVKGKDRFTAKWRGATWRFASAANRDRFKANPAKYAPRYGGYCAYAVSNGYTASTDPDAWTIHKGKLYLNYSLSVRRLWERDKERRISDADGNWPGVLTK